MTEVGYLYQRGDTTAGKRVVCCTLRSLEKIPPERVDLLLVDECHGVGDNRAGEVVADFRFCRKFGFSATPLRNDGTTKVMEALLGPVILDIPYQAAVEARMVVPLKYVLLPCNKGPRFLRDEIAASGRRIRKDLPEVLRKRFTYWKNSGRNRIIADCVRRLLAADPSLQILIMVETLQHAILLNQYLPNFLVAHYGATDIEKFSDDKWFADVELSKYLLKPKELDRIRNAFAKGTLKRVISTFVFKQGVDFKGLAVVVRADGRVSKIDGIQIPGRVARTNTGKEVGYVVDVMDMQDEWALARAKQRQALYRQIGWEEVTEEEMLNDFRRGDARSTGDLQEADGEVRSEKDSRVDRLESAESV